MEFRNLQQAFQYKAEQELEAQKILDNAELETRSLNEQEDADYEIRKSNIKSANNFISNILENSKEVEGVNKNMNIEQRSAAYCKGLESGDFTEFRALTAGATGSGLVAMDNTIPEHLVEQIIKRVKEKSGIASDCKMVQAQGKVTFFIEGTDVKAKMLVENEEITGEDLSQFETVTLEDKRMGTEIVVTKLLLLNSPIVSENYIIEKLSDRIANTLEEQLFYADGLGANMTRGILVNVPVGNKVTLTKNPETDDLQDVSVSLKTQFLNGTKWYMNRETFKVISKLKDGNGQYFLVKDVANGMPIYKFNGFEIKITDTIVDKGGKANIVFGNMSEAMVYKICQNTSLQVLREKYASRSALGLIAEMYGDCAVVNEQAYKVIEFTRAIA